MIFLGKEEVEKLVDPNEIMDQIEEAYRIFGADAYYMPPRPVIEHGTRRSSTCHASRKTSSAPRC